MECQPAADLGGNLIAWSHEAAYAYPISHLTIDPSTTTATDPEIIGYLRLVTKGYASDNPAPTDVMNNLRRESLHPSELPPCFVATGPRWTTPPTKENSWLTPRGTWKDCRWSYTAVRSGAVAAVDASSPAPRYVGVKRILQFHHHDGTNPGWKMVQYHVLHNNSVIEDKMTFCKVLFEPEGDRDTSDKKNKFAAITTEQPDRTGTSSSSSPTAQIPPAPVVYLAPTFFDEFDKMMNDFNAQDHPIYGDMQIYDMFFPSRGEDHEAVPLPLPLPDGGRRQKRKRSQAWYHFTMMHTRDHPEDVYAACHLCDCLLKAHSRRDGTSTLNRHYSNHLKQ